MPLRRLPTSPLRRVSIPGIRPGFFTMKAMSSAGSPPMLKNSNPFSSTNALNVGWVASRTRCPYRSCKVLPKATNGCTSPREPTIWTTTFNGGGACSALPAKWGGMKGSGCAAASACWRLSWLCRAGTSRSESLRELWRILILTRPSPWARQACSSLRL